eukprot:3721201-Pleurochrysis_carterae.AAC.1
MCLQLIHWVPAANGAVNLDSAADYDERCEDLTVPDTMQGFGPWRLHLKGSSPCFRVSSLS